MRLIHTRTLRVENFEGGDIPQYAILSHRWGQEEVTLHDMMTNSGTKLKGYQKIKNACSIAAEHKFDYLWMDTCCIDKTNSVELTEAINSMYRWYEQAEICYAYLADVPPGNDETEAVESKFQKSDWFSRGWTLQELIAPAMVTFLDSQWQSIGNKSDLHHSLTEITGIPSNFLLGDDLRYASVAQKMSWASKRQTTRIEDLAYCLMGIFGIYMPMLYGEGERAFIRLQEEIIRTVNDHSLFAWISTRDSYDGVLAPSPSAFATSGNIVPANSASISTEPPLISSRGIRLSLRYNSTEQLAVLDCTYVEKESMRYAIYVTDLFKTKQDFIREESSKLVLLTQEEIENCVQRDMYIRAWSSKHNNRLGDIEKCAIKIEGIQQKAIANCLTYLDRNWEVDEELIVTTATLPNYGILGRLLVVWGGGKAFQLVVTKYERSISCEVIRGLKANTKRLQYYGEFDHRQYREDRVISKVARGLRIHFTIKKRIRISDGTKNRVDVVELSFPATFPAIKDLAVLEGNIKDDTLLMHAIKQDNESMVKLLLDIETCDANLMDEEGLTPLHAAIQSQNQNIVKLLLDNKTCDANLKDEKGVTPLQAAIQNQNRSMVKLLLSTAKCDVNTRYENGLNLLFLTIKDKNEIAVKLLLDTNKFDKDAEDENGLTPLWFAVQTGNSAIVRLFLKKERERTKNAGYLTQLSFAISICVIDLSFHYPIFIKLRIILYKYKPFLIARRAIGLICGIWLVISVFRRVLVPKMGNIASQLPLPEIISFIAPFRRFWTDFWVALIVIWIGFWISLITIWIPAWLSAWLPAWLPAWLSARLPPWLSTWLYGLHLFGPLLVAVVTPVLIAFWKFSWIFPWIVSWIVSWIRGLPLRLLNISWKFEMVTLIGLFLGYTSSLEFSTLDSLNLT